MKCGIKAFDIISMRRLRCRDTIMKMYESKGLFESRLKKVQQRFGYQSTFNDWKDY